jgi:hypothetical protein
MEKPDTYLHYTTQIMNVNRLTGPKVRVPMNKTLKVFGDL